MLVGLLLLSGATRVLPAVGDDRVTARVGPLTVAATGLHPGRSQVLTSELEVETNGPGSDQLDAALAGDAVAVAIYHQRVNVGEIPDLASCDGDIPPPGVVDHWMHYGPLLVPGRASGPAPPANATLMVPMTGRLSFRRSMTVTLYFAHAGQLTLRLPVDRL